MKIIDIAICKDNIDPLGFGRIRFSAYNETPSTKERALPDYENWSPKDRFVAKPLLPTNINLIPEVSQSVMILVFDTSKETDNQFYIPGPFTTVHDFNAQKFQEQVTHTTFGMSNAYGEKLFIHEGKRKGEYRENRAKGSLAKKEDYGIYGKYGSDLIFTENGVNLRGGKLLSKDFASEEDRLRLISQPLMADRSSTLHLKKFPHILEFQEQQVESISGVTGQVKYFVEYSINNFTGDTNNPQTVDFYVYDTQNAGDDFRIEKTNLDSIPITSGCTLLNPHNLTFKNNNDLTTPTFSIIGLSGVIQTYVNIRNIITQIHNYGLSRVDSFYKVSEMHPFYFRPTLECLNRTNLNETEISNRVNIFQNISPFQLTQKGLLFSKSSIQIPISHKRETKQILGKSNKKQEQTFAALKSDRVYIVSTDTNEIGGTIDFKKIDNYEPTHENYIRDIEPNTYALVRGEILVDVLKSMMDLFESHQHNLTDPLVKEDPNFIRLQNQINTLENDLLNNSIRIN